MRLALNDSRAANVRKAIAGLGAGVPFTVKARAVSRVVGCEYQEACSLLSQMRRVRPRKGDVERAVRDQWERRPDLY